ncbi:MAG: hypothetical protein K5767_03430 [Clostridia bacterium]|nr:hypothetical protein [Clostridia bacterium]
MKNMGKTVVETGTYGSERAGKKKGCGLCASGCSIVCIRGNMINYDIVDGEMDDFQLKTDMPDYGSFRRPAK